ncbi:HAMP domain-containing protein [Oscillibacter valericigenes]|nr:HAMP domain-containing protein [Oscillibacter valericigenes]
MFRSLHMKLVLIMLLLITSLMAVVGAFLMTSVTNFYIDDFYSQMASTFGESNAAFVNSLRAEAAQEGGAAVMQSMLETYSGTLGIDSRNRNYYILDAATGECLAASDEPGGEHLEQTANLLTARNGAVGDESDIAASYMDVAIPISGGDNHYIIYIRDNRNTVSSLNSELMIIILQALLVGLLISVLLSFLLSKTMINPIEKLTEGAERVASGDFSEKLEVDSTDEIGILTTTFNDMASVLHTTLETVEAERNKLDTLFLHMTDGVVAYDRDGVLIHCNPAASELLGRSADECVYSELFEPLCPFETVMTMQRSDFVSSELTVGERTVELYFAPFSDEERGGVLVVLHDVTQQRKAEDRRREFVANVSHELRTPLTNIRSYAETIRDAGVELPRELENNFLDIVINESDRMTHIVQDLLTLSRLDNGRSEMNMARFDFGAAIDAVLRSIALEARRHGHELTHEYRDLPMIMGDRGRIEQVMLNVLGNAVKYTPDGGHIRVTAGAEGEKVWMEVADDGIGIPKEDRSRIFERFYRVDKARSRESGGTGLGLSIATEIVQRHHGTLSLVDRDGPGTTVRLELPVQQAEGQEAIHG